MPVLEDQGDVAVHSGPGSLLPAFSRPQIDTLFTAAVCVKLTYPPSDKELPSDLLTEADIDHFTANEY